MTKYLPAHAIALVLFLSLLPQSKGLDNWSNTSLDGTVSSDTYQPRAAWWAYKHYADSVPTRVQSTSSDVRIVSFASRSDDDAQAGLARLLIGYYAYKKSPSSVEVRLRLQNVAARNVRLKVERIPASGEQPQCQLEVTAEETVPVVRGVVETSLHNVRLHEAYLVTLTPAKP